MENKRKYNYVKFFSNAFLCVALMFSLLQIGSISLEGGNTSFKYFGIVALAMMSYEFVTFLVKRKSEPKPLDYLSILYIALSLTTMILAFVFDYSNKLYAIVAVVWFAIPIIKRIVSIVACKKGRARVYHVLVLIMHLILALVSGAMTGLVTENYSVTIAFASFHVMLMTLMCICMNVFSQFNLNILLKIIRRTYAGEIILGLFLLIIAFSMVLFYQEDGVTSFGDALWYCYAVITTTGFGDIAAKTMIGRIVTILLGAYGIVVVSVLTSIIVNFYNEIKTIPDEEANKQTSINDLLDHLDEENGGDAEGKAEGNPQEVPTQEQAEVPTPVDEPTPEQQQ